MNILQDILGLFKRKKIVKTLQSKDYIPLGTFKKKKGALNPEPDMETVLISAEDLKAYIEAGATPVNPGYKTYIANINNAVGSGDPSVIVYKNELSGPIVWTEASTGVFLGTLVGAFPYEKTQVIVPGDYKIPGNTLIHIQGGWWYDDAVTVKTWYVDATTGIATVSDGVFNVGFSFIEIRVYD